MAEDIHVGIPGISAAVTAEALIIESVAPLTVLSSAVVGGGMNRVRWIVNRHVPHRCPADPEADLQAFVREQGIMEPFVGLMTAVPMERARVACLSEGPMAAAALVTAGVSNTAAPGLSRPGPRSQGTVNVILLIDADLTPAAMVNVVTLAAEVKAHVLLERGLRTAEGHTATGTSTDAIAVACTGRGARQRYGGPATPVGWLVGRCLREALDKALGVAPELRSPAEGREGQRRR